MSHLPCLCRKASNDEVLIRLVIIYIACLRFSRVFSAFNPIDTPGAHRLNIFFFGKYSEIISFKRILLKNKFSTTLFFANWSIVSRKIGKNVTNTDDTKRGLVARSKTNKLELEEQISSRSMSTRMTRDRFALRHESMEIVYIPRRLC